MKAFGFLSFGHYASAGGSGAADMLRDAVDIATGADELGVNGAYFRVHHFARQSAAPMPLLAAIAARTRHIEVGTGVIDMRYENPLHLAEEAAALDLLSEGRVALGVSRGSPEPALRGWEAFGYSDSTDPRGADIARDKFELFLRAVRGEGIADADPRQFGRVGKLRIEPQSAGLAERIWWGAASRETARWAGTVGVNLMSSTLLTEATGDAFADLQAEQIDQFRAAWVAAGHTRAPRVSVTRSIFPLVTELDRHYFGPRGDDSADQVGIIDGFRSTFGKTYAADPDVLIDQLKADAAIQSADTLMLTIPSQLGVDLNLHILETFARYVAPALGWEPSFAGASTG
ncbi:LLM class flavin-dependent oxidoreductase [Mycobacterium manitobense]|uniref:LLM class flavin-dependent oxidoreductase n=1 Tax=[Mycobacterium] manitobense TaxID=190147 RepID=A0A9X3BLE5_9MYCO|nr:LLM class flavin-dependent oxidoreductase [[Mycobacterium] manitobense]MCV7169244.1 LLM class flavin-dependent oxidoreductase [[Mycobacterium] manitobense]